MTLEFEIYRNITYSNRITLYLYEIISNTRIQRGCKEIALDRSFDGVKKEIKKEAEKLIRKYKIEMEDIEAEILFSKKVKEFEAELNADLLGEQI